MSKSIVSPPSVYGKRGGYRKAVYLCPEDIQKAREFYESGLTLHEAGSKVGVSKWFLLQVFRKNGIPVRPRRRSAVNYNLREDAFDNAPHDPVAAYWVGMLFSDGCVVRKGNRARIYLALHGDDSAHVLAFRDFVGAGNGLTTTNANHAVWQKGLRLAVSSARMVDCLERYGITPRKSLTAEVAPALSMNQHFWRGVIDGDGSVYFHHNRRTGLVYPGIDLCGSFQSMNQFAEFVSDRTGSKATTRRNGENCWRVRIVGRFACLLARLLYVGCTIALPRKLAIAEQILTEFPDECFRRTWANFSGDELSEAYQSCGSWGKVAIHFRTSRTQIDRLRRRCGLL